MALMMSMSICTWQVNGGRVFCASTNRPIDSKSRGARQTSCSEARLINFGPEDEAGTKRGFFFDQREEVLVLAFENSSAVYNSQSSKVSS